MRRRRKCAGCGARFNTREVCSDDRRKPFNFKVARAMREEGDTYEAIAARLKLSTATVWLRMNGL